MKFNRKLTPEEFNKLSDSEVDDYIKFIGFDIRKDKLYDKIKKEVKS